MTGFRVAEIRAAVRLDELIGLGVQDLASAEFALSRLEGRTRLRQRLEAMEGVAECALGECEYPVGADRVGEYREAPRVEEPVLVDFVGQVPVPAAAPRGRQPGEHRRVARE